MTAIDIRPATSRDDEAIWAVFQEVIASGDSFAFSPQTTRQQALDFWLHRENTTYVALIDQQIVGSYYLKPNQPGLGAHVCNAGYMVARRARGHGVGRAMGEHSLIEAQRLGYRAMQFNLVVTTNLPAVTLWKRLGFHVVGTLPEAFRHAQLGFVDALVMYRSLPSLRHVLADVPGEHLVDQRLVADPPTARFTAELIEHARIDTDRDQLARFIPKRGASHPSHPGELPGRRLGNLRVINLSRCTPRVRGDSPAAR